MGTRHLIGVVKGEKFRVAQYGQWDGYPDGQGSDTLAFLTKIVAAGELEKFSKQLDKCRFGTQAEIDAAYDAFSSDHPVLGKGMNTEQAKAFKKSKFGHLSRDTGSDILDVVHSNENDEILLVDSSNFAQDGLFCEWAYIVDLDKNTFETYKGFFQTPAPDGERFAVFNEQTRKPDSRGHVSEYYPVHLVMSYFLDELPNLEEFLNDHSEPEDEEDDDEDGTNEVAV